MQTRTLVVRALLAGALVSALPPLSGCEGGLETSDDVPSSLASAPEGATVFRDGCSVADLPAQQGDLVEYLGGAPILSAGSGEYREPSSAELAEFQGAFLQLARSTSPGAVQALHGLGFSVSVLCDRGAPWIVVEDARAGRGGGTFVLNPAPARALWLEAPHADSDTGTLAQGARQLASLGAQALLVTGTNRCASPTPTSCDGATVTCGGQLRLSDVAHAPNNFFTAAHRALRAAWPEATSVSLHGMESAGAEAAVVSDGTSLAQPGSASVRLRDALNRQLPTGRAFSCNDPGDAGSHRPLCGLTNVQGRLDNGSPDACGAAAPVSSGRFLHLEQSAALRGTGPSGDAVTTALAEAFP